MFRPPLALVLLITVGTVAPCEEPPADSVDVSRRLNDADVQADLQELRRVIREKWLLSNLNDADFEQAIVDAQSRLAGGATVSELAIEVQKIVALGQDGHAQASHVWEAFRQASPHYLPFSIEVVKDRYVAVDPSGSRRNQLFRSELPYVVEIDDVGKQFPIYRRR